MKKICIFAGVFAAILFVIRLTRHETSDAPATPAESAIEEQAPEPQIQSTVEPPSPGAPPTAKPVRQKSILERIASNDASVFKLSPDQVQSFLAKNGTNAESLLAAFNITSDKDLLREALRQFPDSPSVLATAIANDALPGQRAELTERLKQLSPDNSLANHLSARDHLKNGQPDLAIKELAEASAKSGFHDFTVERIQGLEEAYLGAGYSAAEAKALAMSGIHLPALSQLRELGREMSALQRQYAAEGDTTSVESLARMGRALADDIARGGGGSLLGQIIGVVVERDFLGGLDPNHTYDFLPQPVRDRLAHLEAQNRSIRDDARFSGQWMQGASDAQLIVYFDRLKLYGESAAINWARSQPLGSVP